MTVGMDDGKFILIDNWPGVVTQGPNPADWTTYSVTRTFPLGTKRAIYDETNHGWATLIYLMFEGASAGGACVVKSLVAPDTGDAIAAGAWYIVTNDGGDSFNNGPIAVALGSVTDEYYGWFWCGGVCPVATISGLDGVYPSGGSVLTGSAIQLADSTVNAFAAYDANTVGVISAFALAADENVGA